MVSTFEDSTQSNYQVIRSTYYSEILDSSPTFYKTKDLTKSIELNTEILSNTLHDWHFKEVSLAGAAEHRYFVGSFGGTINMPFVLVWTCGLF